jgi:iron complex outermembrane receptor protein
MKTRLLFTYTLLLMLLVQAGRIQAQILTVTGRVTTTNGSAQPGVTVLQKGTSNGTSTDSDGRYSISVPGSATLVFSAIGSAAQQIPVNDRTSLDVRLQDAATDLNEVVVTGSRATEGRSNILTTAPVDVISAREIKVFAQTDVSQILTYVAPSFQSSRQAISDGTDHVDPASLRGLGPDQVLVLVNGKRRHSSALVNINGTVGRGSVGTDLNTIPNASIKRIEVLRDGAAAQYGSDAIAGVINIQLKDDTTGVQASSTVGQTYEGDGRLYQADGNIGVGLNGRGFLDLSGQFSNRGYTNRTGTDTAPLIYLGGNGGNYPGSADTEEKRRALKAQDDLLVAQNGYDRNNLRVGQSEARNYGGFLNFGYKLVPVIGLQAYITAGGTYRTGKAAGFYRLPNQLTQTDATIYPNGFLPFINTEIVDQSIISGLRAQLGGFDVDLSNTFGRNELRFDISNTLNASLPIGLSPTNFYAGTIAFRQNTSNLNFTRHFTDVAALSTLNVAFGLEYRADNYQIKAGEPSSYANYGRLIAPGSPAAAGAQVFPGYQPSDAVNRSRTNTAGYIDLESDITEKLLVGVAGRAERYSDFGNNVSGKLAARYSILPDVALRGALSNGFRAPSLQQRYFTNTSTQFVQGAPNQVLTVNNDNPIVRNSFTPGGTGQQGFGIPALKQEKSTNYSLGVTARVLRTATLTVDAYQIAIRDRIVLSSQFSKTANATVAAILGSLPVSQVQFFANAIDTRTRGIDIVANNRMELGPGRLALTVAANFNNTQVRKVNSSSTIDADQNGLQNTLFDRQQRGRIESGQPRSKINLTAGYAYGKFGVEVRTVRFGSVEYKDARLGSPAAPGDTNFLYSSIDQTFGAKWITDLTLSAQLSQAIGLTVGASNIFDVYPDQYRLDPRNNANNFSADPRLNYNSGQDNTNRGRTLYNPNQFGYNGGFYFARLIVNLPTSK